LLLLLLRGLRGRLLLLLLRGLRRRLQERRHQREEGDGTCLLIKRSKMAGLEFLQNFA